MRVAASDSAPATHRSTSEPSRHCLTLRVYVAIEPLRFSIGLGGRWTPYSSGLSHHFVIQPGNQSCPLVSTSLAMIGAGGSLVTS